MTKKLWIYLVLSILLTFSVSSIHPSPAVSAASINVKSFGAKGDGKTDDTKAIQRAITSAKGKLVVIPKGTYRISYLAIPSNTKIAGTSAILKANKPYSYMLKITGSNVSVSGVTIDGNNLSIQGINIGANLSGITIQKSTVQNITQVTAFKGQIPVGVRIDGNTSNVVLDQINIKNITGVFNIGSTKEAIGVLAAPSKAGQPAGKSTIIKNSTFENIGPRDNSHAIMVKGYTQKTNIKIENNTFSKIRDKAIKIMSPGVSIIGNKITNSFNKNNPSVIAANKPFDMTSAIQVSADYVIIDKNTIGGVGSYFAAIELIGTNNITITNNNISNGANFSSSDLIRINAATSGPTAKATLRNITITNNSLKNGLNGVLLNAGVEGFVSSKNIYVNCR
ncbi:glycosyl hydrolase family 28-related protein [Peribacillus alkalitolerans]|uniref:glycosyl hydrolase family 28-related protein n=1 Tax=Peribacillus alkalitolerans TaxID=1550385 RepID=UPI0013D0F0AF|nr:glycosyl hydrolase family 28-related protein [Peribacillus alkalitolerans]